jgi:hypothetical protein
VSRKLLLAILAAPLAAYLMLAPLRQGLREMGTDFPNYYTAAVLTRQHQPLRQFYEWTWFQRQIHYAGIDHQLGSYLPHTPLTMFPLLPLVGLAPQRAKQIWVLSQIILLIASILLLARLTSLGKLEVAVLALLAYWALANNLRLGQYYILILFLFTCAAWCLLRGREFTGGALIGLIFALKLYTAPFVLYFAARRQWKALAGFLGAVAACGLLATAVFGWDAVWFFLTTVMTRAMDGSIDDPYNPGWASMTAFLRRTFLPEAELNPHPALPSPAAFFFLRSLYTLGILAFALVALYKSRGKCEQQAMGWFVVTLFAVSPNEASYHFVLLLLAMCLLLPGSSRARTTALIALYVLVGLPLFPWDRALFPKAWLLLSFFLVAGWPFLRQAGKVPLAATLLTVAAISAALTAQRLQTYRSEAPQSSAHAVIGHAVIDAGAIYSSAPSPGAEGLIYEAIASERYVLRRATSSGIETFAFDGDAFHPAQAQQGSSVVFELVRGGASHVVAFDPATRILRTVTSNPNATEPTLSPDGAKLAFVSAGGLYVSAGNQISLLAAGAVSNPAFFPDGARIVFAQGPPGRRKIAAISAISSAGGGPIETLVADGDCFQPAFAPNGRLLAFTCSTTGARHIWVRDLKSGQSVRLTDGFCNNDAPAWEPNSRSLVFASDCSRGLGLPALYRAELH